MVMTSMTLREMYEAAQELHEAATAADLGNLMEAMESAVEAAREALADSDEEREYTFSDGGGGEETWRGSPSEVEAAWQDWMSDGEWGDREETSWAHGGVEDEFGRSESYTYCIEADEPECADGHAHEWKSPYSVLGGLKENPGVQGHGGGVVCTEVCRHCGTYLGAG